jgi:hypothetical protein
LIDPSPIIIIIIIIKIWTIPKEICCYLPLGLIIELTRVELRAKGMG